MTTIAIHRVKDGALTSADSATLAITDSTGATVLAATPVVPASAGVYSYSALNYAPGVYTATWTFTVAGYDDDVVSRIFQIESPVAARTGITLAEIEQAIAARIGPYDKVAAMTGSSASAVIVGKLRSSLALGDYEDRFLLRRGVTTSGALIANMTEDDRSRAVATYTSSTGTLAPDRNWTLAPASGEELELHYLDPDHLREIALQGLRRCFFWETLEIAATAAVRELNLTDSAPWITRTTQVRRVLHGATATGFARVGWFEPYQSGGDVYIRAALPGYGTLRVEALRPHFSYVNGETALAGPNHDSDVLHVDREYAARAGHIAAWMLQTPKLAPVAVNGLAVTMKQAADAFTLASMAHVKTESEVVQVSFDQDTILDQVGNA